MELCYFQLVKTVSRWLATVIAPSTYFQIRKFVCHSLIDLRIFLTILCNFANRLNGILKCKVILLCPGLWSCMGEGRFGRDMDNLSPLSLI